MGTHGQTLGLSSTAFRGALSRNQIWSASAWTLTGTHMGCWQCRQCLYLLCHEISPIFKVNVSRLVACLFQRKREPELEKETKRAVGSFPNCLLRARTQPDWSQELGIPSRSQGLNCLNHNDYLQGSDSEGDCSQVLGTGPGMLIWNVSILVS